MVISDDNGLQQIQVLDGARADSHCFFPFPALIEGQVKGRA